MAERFGITWRDIDECPPDLLDVYLRALSDMPPLGWTFMGRPEA